MLFRRRCPGCRVDGPRSIPCPACAAHLEGHHPAELVAPTGLDRVVVRYRYDPVVRALVLAAKNGGRRQLLWSWGRELAAIGAFDGAGRDLEAVTWVPASRQGRRKRGYDQGRLLARSVAVAARRPARRLLVRRPGPTRTGADRAERLDGPELRCPVASPRGVLLVDDVVTTGASLSAAAGALRAAGAERVVGLVVAVAGRDPAIGSFGPDDRGPARHYG